MLAAVEGRLYDIIGVAVAVLKLILTIGCALDATAAGAVDVEVLDVVDGIRLSGATLLFGG